MKINRSVRLISASFLLVLFSFGVSSAESIYINADKARFRDGPATTYDILWTAPKYTPVEKLAQYKNWYVVRDNEGSVGWVHKQVVSKGKAAIVTNKIANVRKGPGTSFPKVFSVEQNYLFKVLEKKGSWYKVIDADGDSGWITEQLVWVSR